MIRCLLAAFSGALLGAGLVLSGMSDPNKVLNFLNPLGGWDPSLLVVMAVATTTAFAGYRLVMRRKAPFAATTFHLPHRKGIDAPLMVGAALFGLGWGLAGYCPGPALTALAIAPEEGLYFVVAMVAGMWLEQTLRSGRSAH